MSAWNFMSYESKDNLLEAIRRESAGMFALAEDPGSWKAPTGAGHWQVRDVVGHLDRHHGGLLRRLRRRARATATVAAAYGLPGMAARVDSQARAFRSVPREELVRAARADYAQMREIYEELTADEWTNLHRVALLHGPAAGVLLSRRSSSWTTACTRGTSARAPGGRTVCDGEAADLLVPFMFVLWKYTTVPADGEPVRASAFASRRARTPATRGCTSTARGWTTNRGRRRRPATVLEFDPGSFVLTAFGRRTAGTIRGDRTQSPTATSTSSSGSEGTDARPRPPGDRRRARPDPLDLPAGAAPDRRRAAPAACTTSRWCARTSSGP